MKYRDRNLLVRRLAGVLAICGALLVLFHTVGTLMSSRDLQASPPAVHRAVTRKGDAFVEDEELSEPVAAAVRPTSPRTRVSVFLRAARISLQRASEQVLTWRPRTKWRHHAVDQLEEIDMLLSQLTEEPVDPGELEGLCQLASLLVELQNQVHCHTAAANPELFDTSQVDKYADPPPQHEQESNNSSSGGPDSAGGAGADEPAL